MKSYSELSADLVWQKAASDLMECPDHSHEGRNGKTLEFLPCILRIQDPRRRWILSRSPPYNPAFGLVEFIWIITGNNESCVLNYWNPSLPNYSGNGDEYHGAYGYRLRHEFGIDQICRAFHVLTSAPETRQVVLQIWRPDKDLPGSNGKPTSDDIPCNLMSLLKLRDGRLHWSQVMRSNDIMRGLPYNIIQFTLLQEMMASWLGCELGEYFHLSDSLHVYEQDLSKFEICQHSVEWGPTYPPFSMSYEETQDMFSAIYKDLGYVSMGGRSPDELQEVFCTNSDNNRNRCLFVRDMLAIIGSDAARREGYGALALSLANSCHDRALQMAGLAWLEHQEKGK